MYRFVAIKFACHWMYMSSPAPTPKTIPTVDVSLRRSKTVWVLKFAPIIHVLWSMRSRSWNPKAITFPQFMKEIIAEITQLARRSNDISQRSGVSVRVSISNFENVLSSASRRALRLKVRYVAPRMSDLPSIMASTAGKIEIDAVGDVKEER